MSGESSVWPYDALQAQNVLKRRRLGHFIVFLACPFSSPPDEDDLLKFVKSICSDLGKKLDTEVECRRVDELLVPGVIHADIWRDITMFRLSWKWNFRPSGIV
jgi:hypothetical protein